MNLWRIKRDVGYRANADIWLDRLSMPAVKCTVCSDTWMIPTTHPVASLTTQAKLILSELTGPVDTTCLSRIRRLMKDYEVKLFPGAGVGPATVVKLKGKVDRRFSWYEGTPILTNEDFHCLQKILGKQFVGCKVDSYPGLPKLVEVVPIPLNLEVLYPKIRCVVCDRRDTLQICRDELDSVYKAATKKSRIYAIPGGLMCGDSVRTAIESLRIENCSFTPIH